ncbi:MAG: transketolase [Firmicutes bacterium]|jgi:transketolase|nr:transketolase [Bacillota bacterium]
MPKNVSVEELKAKAKELRINILKTAKFAGSGHFGGSLSSADILTALYYKFLNVDPGKPSMPERDKFILSKGHAALAYVPCLAMKGFVPMESLESFNHYESAYGMHPDANKIEGCDASTGSLGHGLSLGVGMALGDRYQNLDTKVVVLMGDGEQNEGSIWEAAMAASHFKLNNLIAIVDKNRFCIDGCTDDIMSIEPLGKKYEAFGFKVIECNGNDMAEVDRALEEAWAETEKPVCIVANTQKGFGVKRFQGTVEWHYGAMDIEMFNEALADVESL